MKVKVHVKYWETQEEVVNPETKEKEVTTIKHYEPDVQGIPYTVVEYNYKENWAIIEISKEDYEKIKDKVIEVIEERF